MVTTLAVARRLVPAPSMNDMKFRTRGFPAVPNDIGRRYEGVSRAVLEGFEYGSDIRDVDEIVARLEWIDPIYRSLAYEGAVGALALRDLMSLRRSDRAVSFVRGPGASHSLLAYIGFGLVLSHVPRRLWQRAVPRLDGMPLVEHLHWLAVDGYAFDRAFFDPQRWIVRKQPAPRLLWDGDRDYFARVFDQGIGRAIAFYHGGDFAAIAGTVAGFEPGRLGDLWSGVGVVCAYMGGPDRRELQRLVGAAGPQAPDLAIGVVMGVKARHQAGFIPESAVLAAETVCESDPDEVAALASAAADDPPQPDAGPAYEQWRQRIRDHFADLAVAAR